MSSVVYCEVYESFLTKNNRFLCHVTPTKGHETQPQNLKATGRTINNAFLFLDTFLQ